MNTTAPRPDRALETWVEQFVIALRMREVPGDRIGDLVTEVRSHCAESGEPVSEAFGSPRDYAAERAREIVVPDRGPAGWARALGPVLLGLAGLYIALPTVEAFRRGGRVDIPWSMLTALVVLSALAALVARFGDSILARRGGFVIGAAIAFAAFTIFPMVWRSVAFSVSPLVGAVAALILLSASVVGASTWGKVDEDPVTDPVSGRELYADDRGARAAGAMLKAQPWLFVAVTAVLSALTWLAS